MSEEKVQFATASYRTRKEWKRNFGRWPFLLCRFWQFTLGSSIFLAVTFAVRFFRFPAVLKFLSQHTLAVFLASFMFYVFLFLHASIRVSHPLSFLLVMVSLCNTTQNVRNMKLQGITANRNFVHRKRR